MDEWIKERMDYIKEINREFPDQVMISDPAFEWIESTLKMAWVNGKDQGRDEAYANLQKIKISPPTI